MIKAKSEFYEIVSMDTCQRFIVPSIAALVAGAMNAMAGGGSFLSFPALLGARLLPIMANATNTVAMWPGELASVFAFRQELRTQKGDLMPIVTAGALGGAAGALALLKTSQARFIALVPWLLLFATALFAFGDPLRKLLEGTPRKKRANSPGSMGLFISLLFVSFYTGYFGAGAGILVFTTLSLFDARSLNESNAIKALCTTLANGVAVVIFVLAGAVSWPQCIVMAGLAAVGGYGGATYSRRISARALRIIVISTGTAISAYLFLQQR